LGKSHERRIEVALNEMIAMSRKEIVQLEEQPVHRATNHISISTHDLLEEGFRGGS
jgi:hypothetical protein